MRGARAAHLACRAVYPFLCDYQRVWEMDLARDAYDELTYYFKRFDPTHEHEAEVFTRLGYIDVQHLAERIRARVQMTTSLMDMVCPPSTQFAAYNKIRSDKEMILYRTLATKSYQGTTIVCSRSFPANNQCLTSAASTTRACTCGRCPISGFLSRPARLEAPAERESRADYVGEIVGYPAPRSDWPGCSTPTAAQFWSSFSTSILRYAGRHGHAEPGHRTRCLHGARHTRDFRAPACGRHRLQERGAVAITAGANRGGFAAYFTDPDGITLELLQPPPATA